MVKPAVDYSIYLVTDSGLVPKNSTLLRQIQLSIEGGATIVQLREKHADTRDFIELARQVHDLTRNYGIPLIINDRLDVAQAIDAEGIHVGQDDIDIPSIRRIWGQDKIIGVSVRDEAETRQAIQDNVDYVGIGAVFGTLTKELKNAPIGCSGVRDILKQIRDSGKDIKSVAIGGINQSNTELVRHLTHSDMQDQGLDGIAVVSCIIAAQDAKAATKELASLWRASSPWQKPTAEKGDELVNQALSIVGKVHEISPLVHHMTNPVVKNISANITIAAGASPVMSECKEEFADLAALPYAALLVNMGSPTAQGIDLYTTALRKYNEARKSTVFDPVGAGSSTFRRKAVSTLLDSAVYSVIKGNVGEIAAAAKVQGVEMKGVDSVGSVDVNSQIKMAKQLALDNRCVVVLTGKTDIVTDGHQAITVDHGHEYLAYITGSGCILGSLITSFAAAATDTPFAASLGALLLYTIAAEKAALRNDVQGPGTFVPALLDEIYKISNMSSMGNMSWADRGSLAIEAHQS